ncbi:ABC transporter permease, partial [Mycolicibacter sp. MYC340]|nr:ABC transporter permease [Mycolicibacter sp. MYC340]
MSTSTVVRGRFPGLVANYQRYVGMAGRGLERSGRLGWFSVTALRQIPWALRRYRTETLRLVAELGMGTGAMAVIGGTVAIMGFVMLAGGSLIAIQG